MSDTTAPVRLWRCASCGKWSHAVRRPRRHERWVRPGDEGYDEALNERRSADGWMDPNMPDAHPVSCGPFEAWIAQPAGADR